MEGITFEELIPIVMALFSFTTVVFFVAFVIRRMRRVL